MADSSRPVPYPDIETKPYWDAARQHRFELPKCQECGYISFPPKPRCPKCYSINVKWVELSGKGHLHSYCVMHDTFVRGLEPPFVIGEVELADQPGLCIISNLTNCPREKVAIGMPLEVTFEDVSEEITLPQFKPVEG